MISCGFFLFYARKNTFQAYGTRPKKEIIVPYGHRRDVNFQKGVHLGITKKRQYWVGITRKNDVGRGQSTVGSPDEYFSDWN